MLNPCELFFLLIVMAFVVTLVIIMLIISIIISIMVTAAMLITVSGIVSAAMAVPVVFMMFAVAMAVGHGLEVIVKTFRFPRQNYGT